MLMDYWDSFLSANRLVDRDISLADWIILDNLIVDLLFFSWISQILMKGSNSFGYFLI